MINPYTGEALKTYDKIHSLRVYETNKLYPFKDTFYFINAKGYMHILTLNSLTYNSRKSFYIADNLLTKTNELKNVGQYTRLYDTKIEAIEALKEGCYE